MSSNYRLYNQAYETAYKTNAQPGDLIQPFNYKKIDSGICPTLTTRPEGLKTAIFVVEKENAPIGSNGCVDCDECIHRSEDCLCDISNNNESCPLVNVEEVSRC